MSSGLFTVPGGADDTHHEMSSNLENVAEGKRIEPRARSLAPIPSLSSTAQGISPVLASGSSSVKIGNHNSDFLPPRVLGRNK